MTHSSNRTSTVRRAGHLALAVLVATGGCKTDKPIRHNPVTYQPVHTEIEYPEVCEPCSATLEQPPPMTLRRTEPHEYWPLSLEETVRIMLAESEVIRGLGARVIAAPQGVPTVFDPAIQQADPRSGPDAALSAFDAASSTSIFWNRAENSFNNPFFGGGASSVDQNSADFTTEFSKIAATGSRFSARNVINYNRSSAAANLFNSAYTTAYEIEARHPLLRGGGLEFNRIAGPNATPGNYNGVVLARLNTDIAIADFEFSTRNLVLEVVRAYWRLYFAYRNLDARKAGRAASLNSWRNAQIRLEEEVGDIEEESLARDQYYLNESLVLDALSGSENLVGVYAAERELRRLMGLPQGQRLIRPSDEPSQAEAIFDWSESAMQAADRRVELRRQMWNVKQRELELIASRNLLLPQFDIVGLYRWNGFGDDLFGDKDTQNGSAYDNLISGDLQGWQLGAQMQQTIGRRRAHAGVRFAQLRLAREKAVLREQQRQITIELGNAFAELDRAYAVTRTNFNRFIAARQRLRAIEAKYQEGAEGGLLEFVLAAQSRAVDAATEYYRGLVDYNLAINQVHLTRGTFLPYVGVYLTEGAWSPQAYKSSSLESQRFVPRKRPTYVLPDPVTRGPFQQLPPPRTSARKNEVEENGTILDRSIEGLDPEDAPPGIEAYQESDGRGPYEEAAPDADQLLRPEDEPLPPPADLSLPSINRLP